ncbi:type IV pilus modification protein PilV [Cognatilysobacter lacus]|uniref:Type IV pilus modification protein PilV n=1 Tax=Cognatilysobacter lacus TaxID=1643323 RepID=A0A5D8ZB04_9GAMM|nr:type IV pilus modification protein PilV [Lysobacter lacus]TZF91827.1 type IV pilus modification protein PilV [Lysobacter lacus]
MNRVHSSKQSGIGLIEVLIAVLILGIGMLGIAALQTMTLRNVGSSAERTQAVMQTYAMLDTLRAQRAAAVAGSFNTGGDFQCSSATAFGTPGTLDGWLADIRQTVAPSACGQVSCSAAGTCTIDVRWSEARATGGSPTNPTRVTTVSRL